MFPYKTIAMTSCASQLSQLTSAIDDNRSTSAKRNIIVLHKRGRTGKSCI